MEEARLNFLHGRGRTFALHTFYITIIALFAKKHNDSVAFVEAKSSKPPAPAYMVSQTVVDICGRLGGLETLRDKVLWQSGNLRDSRNYATFSNFTELFIPSVTRF